MNLNLIRIDDLRALRNNWPLYLKGAERCIDFGRDDIDLNGMYNMLFAGDPAFKLWEVQIDGEYSGFMVTRIYEPGKLGLRVLLIYALFSAKKLNPEIYLQGLDYLNDYARLMGCKRLEAYSMRPGMQKLIQRYGWEPTFTVFGKEVI